MRVSTEHRFRKIGISRGRRIGENRQRRLQSMRKIAGMGARFFRLALRVFEQRVDLIHQRGDFGGERLCDAVVAGRAQFGNSRFNAAQRGETIADLQQGHDKQA